MILVTDIRKDHCPNCENNGAAKKKREGAQLRFFMETELVKTFMCMEHVQAMLSGLGGAIRERPKLRELMLGSLSGFIQEASAPDVDQYLIGTCLKTSFVQWAVGVLPKPIEEKLESLDELGTGNWKDSVTAELGVDADFVRRVYAGCEHTMGRDHAIRFILRGLGVEPNEQCFVWLNAARPSAADANKRSET